MSAAIRNPLPLWGLYFLLLVAMFATPLSNLSFLLWIIAPLLALTIRNSARKEGLEDDAQHASWIMGSAGLFLLLVFLLIGGAAAAGFTASTTSSTLAAVRRKQRLLGLLRLGGFSTLELLLFPLLQALLTAVLGTGLALGLYAAAQGVVNRIFAAGLDDMEHVCRLLPEHAVVTLVLVCLLSLLAALLPSLRGARTEPSEVIREI